MKSSPPRLNPKTDLIVSRYLRFPAFFFGRFLPQTCPFAQTFRLISTAPDLPVRTDFPPYSLLLCRFFPSDFF